MRSQLTRGVFRRLLVNQGFVFRCPHRPNTHIHGQCSASTVLRAPLRRSIFGFAPRQEKARKEADMDPGLAIMLDLGLRLQQNARPPDAKELATGFRKFILHKNATKQAITKLQAEFAYTTFEHLRVTDHERPGFGVGKQDLVKAMDAVSIKPRKGYSQAHVWLARDAFAELKKRHSADAGAEKRTDVKAFFVSTVHILEVLTTTGHTEEAEMLLDELIAEQEMNFPGRTEPQILKLYNMVIKGYGGEDKDAQLISTWEKVAAKGLPLTKGTQLEFIRYYAGKDNVEKTKEWFEKEVAVRREGAEQNPLPEALKITMQLAARNNELEWLDPLFKSIIKSNPYKPTWDVMLLWAAEVLGKGPEEVERMMDVMEKHNGDNMDPVDMDTFNLLVKSAVDNNNPYLAERYIALAEKRGIRPNAETLIMQMSYRLDAGDFSGAQSAYDALKGEDLTGDIDVPVVNKYIRLAAAVAKPDYDRIMLLLADIEERDLLWSLEADTVSALCLLHLRRGETQETINNLQSVVYHVDRDDRDKIRDAILTFIYDRTNTTAQAWDAYSVIRTIFPETGRDIRSALMTDFFDRRRSDMACYVFGHMRAHELLEIRPSVDTYAACFLGIAKCDDEESLRMVHNMMKMDVSIEPNTKLYNSLMIAWTACGDADKALDFWVDITNSREGPSYRSLEIVFRVCEKMDFGEKTAKDVWGTMRRMEIEVTKKVFNAYVGALAGQVKIEEAKRLVEDMEGDVAYGPDVET